jgi:hypothetical protein
MIETSDRDKARNVGMSLPQLERWLSDMDNEPNWRPSANRCADYYDHKQSTLQQLQDAEETGERRITVNLIQRTINGALGQEAKTRLGWKAEPDAAVFDDVAAVLNERLHETQRETNIDMVISEAYKSMLVTGIGWVEVKRSTNPLAYPISATAVHRNMVWHDWRARNSDKSDANWVIVQKWVDLEEAMVLLPKYRELLEIGCHSGPITDSMANTILTSRGQFEDIHDTRRSFSRAEEEWLDNSVRKRVRMYSVYYKRPTVVVALVSGTRRVKFNPKNKLHQMALQLGAARLQKGPGFEIRHAMFVGPYRLWEEVLPGQRFPLIPFVCYSCDDDRSPYGLVHGMIEPQDEFNDRRTRLLWLLKAKQVFADNDALDTKYNNFADIAKEAMRPDAFFVLNAQRKFQAGVRIEQNGQLQAEQRAVMEDSKVLIQDQPGLYSPMFGSNSVGAESGVALNSLVEQSTTSLGETSDNYRTSRRAVGEMAMQLIVEDLGEAELRMEVGTGKRRRTVVLNTFNEQGIPVNHVDDAAVRVALGDVPITPAYKAQQQIFLAQGLQAVGNDPIARAVLVPALIESGDLEHRHEYAKWLRSKYGVPEPGEMGDQEEEAQQAQAQQQAQAMQNQAAQAAMAADIAEKQSKVKVNETTAALNIARAKHLANDTALRVHEATQPQPEAANDEDALIEDAIAEARQVSR